MIHKGFLAAFQVSMLLMKFCIDGTRQGFWQPTVLLEMAICHVSARHRYAILSGEFTKGRQSVAAPLASDFCKSDDLQLFISHFRPFNVVKCCQRTAVTMALTLEKEHGISTNWPNIATKFAKRGTVRNLLPSNWSTWHPAASATQRTEFDGNH